MNKSENCCVFILTVEFSLVNYLFKAQIGVPTRKYGIFLTMLETAERNYPMHVVVLAQAKVQDLIGLICWKYTLEHGQHKLK
jgi:hypothetical protein